jgi:heme/copper-type cytochrome/quinol oxidase subunit 2
VTFLHLDRRPLQFLDEKEAQRYYTIHCGAECELALFEPGYIAPIVVTTVGYALLQTANNTAVMTDIRPDQRGTVSGMLNLSRNLGLITGASVMGAVFVFVFAFASATINITTARPETVATGMQITFAVAAILIVVPLAIVVRSRALATSPSLPGDVS